MTERHSGDGSNQAAVGIDVAFFVGHYPYLALLNDPGYPARYKFGGGESFARNLATSLTALGTRIDVFTTAIDRHDTIERDGNVTVHRYGSVLRVVKQEPANISLSLLMKAGQHPMPLVHLNGPSPVSDLAALFYLRRHHVPYVITYHGDFDETSGRRLGRLGIQLYHRLVLPRLLNNASAIITLSRQYIDQSRFLPAYRDKITIVGTGVTLDEFNLPETQSQARVELNLGTGPLVLFLGTLIPKKGADVLIKAMPRVLATLPNARLVVVGRGQDEPELKKLTVSLGLGDRVLFPGFVNGRRKALYYRAADVFVVPSVVPTEVMPVVLLEAGASGLPIVASDLETFRSFLVNGDNALLVARGDEAALATALVRVLTETETREHLVTGARRTARQFSWQSIAEATLKVYRSVLQSGSNTRR